MHLYRNKRFPRKLRWGVNFSVITFIQLFDRLPWVQCFGVCNCVPNAQGTSKKNKIKSRCLNGRGMDGSLQTMFMDCGTREIYDFVLRKRCWPLILWYDLTTKRAQIQKKIQIREKQKTQESDSSNRGRNSRNTFMRSPTFRLALHSRTVHLRINENAGGALVSRACQNVRVKRERRKRN